MKYTHVIFAIDENASAVEMYATVNEYLRERGEYSEYQDPAFVAVQEMVGGYIMRQPGLSRSKLVEENSYLIPADLWPIVAPYAREQESILLLSEMHAKPELRKATLRFLVDGYPDVDRDVDLGWFQEAREVHAPYRGPELRELATEYGGYTWDPRTKRLFVATHTIL